MERIDGIYPTECVCFPRSGHHALRAVLAAYFGSSLHYRELHADPPGSPRIGDLGSTVNYQKNHDLDLASPVLADRLYLVQYRDPLAALTSRYDLDERTGVLDPSCGEPAGWREWYRGHLDYWHRWVDKWVVSPVPRRLVVDYSRMLARPREVCSSVVQFVTGVQNVDEARLEEALRLHPLGTTTGRRMRFVQVA